MSTLISAQKKCKTKYYKCHSIEDETTIDYLWVIEKFKHCTEKNGKAIKSSLFPNEEEVGEWYLNLYPNGMLKGNEGYLSIFLYRTLDSIHLESKCSAIFKIVDGKGSIKKSGTFDYTFREGFGEGFGYHKFLERKYAMNPKMGFLTDGKLMIHCEITFYKKRKNFQQTGEKAGDIFAAGLSSPSSLNEGSVSELLTDFGDLLESGNLSDISLCVTGKVIKAHKNILSARSRVFSAMFAHGMKENKDNEVEICDISYEVISEMLRFIYTGKSPDLEEKAEELLVAADKYDLPGLKQKTQNFLIKKLDKTNAVSSLILADKHCAGSLKLKAIKFIKTYLQDVMNTPAWTDLLNCPRLTNEIFQSFVSPTTSITTDSHSDSSDTSETSNDDTD